MDVAATIFITIAVLFGMVLLGYVLADIRPPKGIAFLHGGAAAIGVILLLLYAIFTDDHHKHWDSLTVFLIAIVLGSYVISKDIRHKPIPKWAAILHGLIGGGGLAWLGIHILGNIYP